MTDRRMVRDRTRHSPSDGTTLLVEQHRQLPAGPRQIGWAIVNEAARTRYVEMDVNGDWSWTNNRRDATLFITKTSAERWATRNIGGGALQAVEVSR